MTTTPDNPALETAVIGAGVVGCAVAWALARSGHPPLLIDRAAPATAGASFGNVGHIATEQLEPLPSLGLLLRFWRELTLFGGVLDVPVRRLPQLAPWMVRFARAALRQPDGTARLGPLVRSSADRLQARLGEIGRTDLLRRHGHHAVWMGPGADTRRDAGLRHATALGVAATNSAATVLAAIAQAASKPTSAIAGVWFPDTAHVVDPALVARSFATAALQAGGRFLQAQVGSVRPRGAQLEINTSAGVLQVRRAVVCAGAWSAPLLAGFGLHAPLEAERGYHVELQDHAPLAESPILYADHNVVVTPMQSRLRASSFLEFAGLAAAPDAGKSVRLRATLQRLGYRCEAQGPFWMGPRPTLPDYLPAIGRAPGAHELYYATGHQHLGLTLAAVTADIVAALVNGQPTPFDIQAFDLRRFGPLRSS